jgi:predicted amidophosphoribosyltransferase
VDLWNQLLGPCALVGLVGPMIVLSALLWARAHQRRYRLRIAAGRCPNCDYDLTANRSGYCPECREPVPDELLFRTREPP